MITIHDEPATAEQWIEHIATLDADHNLPCHDPKLRLEWWRWRDDCGYTDEAIGDLGIAEARWIYAAKRGKQ